MTTPASHLALMMALCVAACANRPNPESATSTFSPSEAIDLGAVVTENLPQQFWGKAFMKQMGFLKQNTFEVINWKFPRQGGSISGSNAYYTLFNQVGHTSTLPTTWVKAGAWRPIRSIPSPDR